MFNCSFQTGLASMQCSHNPEKVFPSPVNKKLFHLVSYQIHLTKTGNAQRIEFTGFDRFTLLLCKSTGNQEFKFQRLCLSVYLSFFSESHVIMM